MNKRIENALMQVGACTDEIIKVSKWAKDKTNEDIWNNYPDGGDMLWFAAAMRIEPAYMKDIIDIIKEKISNKMAVVAEPVYIPATHKAYTGSGRSLQWYQKSVTSKGLFYDVLNHRLSVADKMERAYRRRIKKEEKDEAEKTKNNEEEKKKEYGYTVENIAHYFRSLVASIVEYNVMDQKGVADIVRGKIPYAEIEERMMMV
jgi:hypothetical protein